MRRNRTTKKALSALNYDLFRPESQAPPAPATLYTKIKQYHQPLARVDLRPVQPDMDSLPTVAELQRLFDRFNWTYFGGKLPDVRIEYSTRMLSAGSYTPHQKLIKIGRKYHEIFPADIDDTLKHEMIHILHFKHDAAFRAEAARIGTSVRARAHPLLRKPPRYVYVCRNCGQRYPRQKRLVMASCGSCSSGRRFDPRFKLKRLKSNKRTH